MFLLHQDYDTLITDIMLNRENQLEAVVSNNAEEMVSLSETHANEKGEIIETHKQEQQKADEVFRVKISELEHRHVEMEKVYLDELQKLRQTSEFKIHALQELNRAENEERELSAKTALEALQNRSQQELDDLRSSTQTAYTELQQRSQAEFAELQRTSAEELTAAKSSLTAEILSLKKKAVHNLTALADRSERELQDHREQSNESLQMLKVFYAQEREYLLEKAAEEVARLRMFEIDQSTRLEARRYGEIKALGDQLAATKADSSRQIEELQRRYMSELEILRATSEAEKKMLLQTHAEKVENIVTAAAQELSQTISSYEVRLHTMAEAHATEVAQDKEETAQAREALVTKYESDLISLQNERAREKDTLILHHATELETFKQKFNEEYDKSLKLHETQLLYLRETHSSKVLNLEMTIREQTKTAEDMIQEKDSLLEYKQGRIIFLETNEIAQKRQHEQYVERSLEIVEQKNMALSELESEILRLDQLNLEKDTMLDNTNRTLSVAEEDLQVKANTILELTFVIKSRDDEIEKLRNSLLDTVQTVNTKTEILELTTESLSSKAKELEATKNALRLESGKLSMVEESMNQKVGLLENTELKMESMRFNMENMRLEMKRMQMDMKLQLEHTEGEIELKNGEIRRVHGTQSELKQKNDFCQQTIARLEESLAFAQRQGEESQRRIELLRLEATQAAEDMKKVCDELLSKEQDVVVLTREKQKSATEKQQLQIQFNNLTQKAQTLHERVELHIMQAEEIQCRYQRLLQETIAERDDRIRSEKHLHLLELSAAKEMIRHLEEQLGDTTSKLEAVTSEKQRLQEEIKMLMDILKKSDSTGQQLHAANECIKQKDELIESKIQELVELKRGMCNLEDNTRYQLNRSCMQIEDVTSTAWGFACDKDKVVRKNNSLEEIISKLRMENEQLVLSLGQEKREIVSRAEDLQEKIAGLRKEGIKATSEISDLQHALNEKKKELEYLQSNLGEQMTDTRKIKCALDSLNSNYTELQAQYASLSNCRQKEVEEHIDTIQTLQENFDNKSLQCEELQQSLSVQHKEIELLMMQHNSQVMQLSDGHRCEAVKLKEKNISDVSQLTDKISQLVEEHRNETSVLKQTHRGEIDRLTHNLQQVLLQQTTDEQIRTICAHALELMTVQVEYQQNTGLIEKYVLEVEPEFKAEISKLQAQLRDTKLAVIERDAVVAAKSATIDNVRKELNLLEEIGKSTHSSGQFVALIRQRLETHVMEVYHVSLNELEGFVLEDESDLLDCLKSLFAVRCYRGVGSSGHSEPNKAVVGVNEIRQRLREYDGVIAALDQEQEITDSRCVDRTPSRRIVSLQSDLRRLKAHVDKIFIPGDTVDIEGSSTNALVQLLDNLSSLFNRLAIPKNLEHAFIRSRKVITTLNESENLMVKAKSSGLMEIQSVGDVGRLFTVIDKILARAREVTKSKQFVRLDDMEVLFDEWEGLHKELDDSIGGKDYYGQSHDVATGSLRNVEILISKDDEMTFAQRCKKALLLPDDEIFTPDDVVEAIEQLMKILQHFELLQPKLGSPRRQPTATDPVPTLKNKVTAVLAFVEELQLIADFAQNILNDEDKNEGSNESSRSSLEALRALTRSPTPATTLDELQIDDVMQGLEQKFCEFSHDGGDGEQDDDFISSEDKSSSPSPSPFLADSLMDISLVISDHHRLLSQTARWVANSRQGGIRSHSFSVGTEISRLVREHCALLSLCRRLFKMKDPQRELVSLLEAVALLERVAGRLAIFKERSSREPDETSCHPMVAGGIISPDSMELLDSCDVESLSHPTIASIGDIARNLQDYDYFLQHVKLDGWMDQEKNSPVLTNIENFVQEINDRAMLVDQSKEMFGLENPVEELSPFLIGVQEVLKQAKQLRGSSVCIEENKSKPGDDPQHGVEGEGFDALLCEMDVIVNDLREYNDMLEWMKEVLPDPESVKSVADLKDRVKSILNEIKTSAVNNMNLMQDSQNLTSELEQVKQIRNQLVQEAAAEEALLQELAALETQALLSPVAEVSTRIELVQALIKQQKRACEDVQQWREDMIAETSFLRQHDLLSTRTDDTKEITLSVNMRLEIYSRLLKRADDLQTEKMEMESSLNEEIKQKSEKLENVESELAQTRLEMENALAEERDFLSSKETFSSILNGSHVREGVLSRIDLYQNLHDKMEELLDEKHAVDADAAREYEFLKTNGLLQEGVLSRIELYQNLHDKMEELLDEKNAVDTDAAREYEFLKTNGLLPHFDNVSVTVPTTSSMSSVRMETFRRLVDLLSQLRQHKNDLIEEHHFLEKNTLAFDLNEPQKSRIAVYKTLLAGQNALIEEKMEREVSMESKKAFLSSHGVPDFENPMEIYEQYIQARKQLADLTTELEEELRFLTENQLYSCNELDNTARLTTPFSSSFRFLVYQKLLQSEVQGRERTQKLKESMEQEMAQQTADDECAITSLTAKVERLEASLMRCQEFAYASQQEWDRMLLEEEAKHQSLIRQHDETQKQVAVEHSRALDELTLARDSAVALASATHTQALELATKEHEKRLKAELDKQAQQFELATFVHSENEARELVSETSVSHNSTSTSVVQSRAQLLEKLAKRDTTAIGMIYKTIRLTTDILSAVPSASSMTTSPSTPHSSEVSTNVTQTVLACVKELKTLKDFLVQSLEEMTKDDEHVPPFFSNAPYAKWMADAVTRATADKDCAIDLALCSHREFMSFAEVQLLTRQEGLEKALTRVYDKLKVAAMNGAFTPDQEKQLALELEVTRQCEARETVACKFRLNEEYYRRLLDERKEMEIAQTAKLEQLREECKTLRLKHEKLEQQIQQHNVLPQFRPSSSSMYALSPRAPMAPSRVLKTAVVLKAPMPIRPERPRGGNAHKDSYISDLESATGQRRTNTAARRFNAMKTREDAITESHGTQLEQDFRAMRVPTMELAIPTAIAAPATAPGSSLQNQEIWYQGVRSIHFVSFFISIFHVPKQQLFRVEVFNSDTEQQQQTVYVTWTEMQAFLQESRKAVRLGIALPVDPEMAVTVSQQVRSDIVDVLFERVRVYGEGSENLLLGFE
ncbi:hypothetical protein PHMEG_0005161 [Phytophthora megakarya]|uniref:Uncharacterized protein n=1 Tax=Phytophthora megakarya TaxID=4795 RepID=A0A225WRZ7_9STRA|nr:hypothetical protein PHMEG_0005161 [Phytophthora megakarya]